MTQPLHVKHRPSSLDEVVGQDAVVKSLRSLLGSNRIPHAFLFTGPSGVGKTTLARIIATEVGTDARNITELDAATYSGVGDMRNITAMLTYKGMGSTDIKFMIVDEAHALSKATWQALLLNIEEPPPHVYWVLCTTELDKVPKTIMTRCTHYDLKPIRKDVMGEYLATIIDADGLETTEEIFDMVVDKAGGSMRQALVYLSAVSGIDTRKEAHDLMATVEDAPLIIDLARKLLEGKGLNWKDVTTTVAAMQEEGMTAEGVRIVTVNYLAAVLMKAADERRAVRILTMLEAFKEPYRTGEKMAPLLLSLGTIMFQGD